jgi:hypothetical protein
VIQPQAGAQEFEFDRSSAELLFYDVSAAIRVEGGGLRPGGVCIDQAPDVDAMNLALGHGGALTGSFGEMVSSGHFAGPLAQDLGRVLIRGRRRGCRRPTFDFRGSLPFAVGPFRPGAADVLTGDDEAWAATRIPRRLLLTRNWTFTLPPNLGLQFGSFGVTVGALPVEVSGQTSPDLLLTALGLSSAGRRAGIWVSGLVHRDDTGALAAPAPGRDLL